MNIRIGYFAQRKVAEAAFSRVRIHHVYTANGCFPPEPTTNRDHGCKIYKSGNTVGRQRIRQLGLYIQTSNLSRRSCPFLLVMPDPNLQLRCFSLLGNGG